MKKNKNIEPEDKYGHPHGYQEWYNGLGNLWVRCTYKHGHVIGYEEWHTGGYSKATRFNIR